MTEATAPGKLLLSGEYAVLAGAPAVAVAVDVRARARSWPSPDAAGRFVDDATGQAFDFSIDRRGRLAWQAGAPPAGRGALLEALIGTAADRSPGAWRRAVAVSLETRAFRGPGGAKLGLGSSAAGLVALAGALAPAFGWPPGAGGLEPLCLAAHRAFQQGRGSGVDVLTALRGGLLGVHPDADQPRVQALGWPAGLELVAVSTGRPADTVAMIDRFEAFRRERPAAWRQRLAALAGAADQALQGFGAGAAEALAGLQAYEAALGELDRDAGLGIATAEHQRLRAIAARSGALYKTSGAGGGDLGFAATDSAAVAASLRADFGAAGFRVLGACLLAPGLQVLA